MSGGGNSGGLVWAIVTILAALIGAYATLNANKPNPTPTFVPPSPSLTPTPTEPKLSPTVNNIDIDWGNLNQYFEIWKVNFKAGFQEGTSELTFLVRAKGDFNGEMTATYYNADGLEVCDPMCIGSGNPVSVTKSDSEFRFPYGSSYFWQKDVVFKASLLLIPAKATKIKLNFSQSP